MKFFAAATLIAVSLSSQAFGIDCYSRRSVVRTSHGVEYFVKIERAAFDQLPGTPVAVTVSSRVWPGNGTSFSVMDRAAGRAMGSLESALNVDFSGANGVSASIRVAALAAGQPDSGTWKAKGEFILGGWRPVPIYCK